MMVTSSQGWIDMRNVWKLVMDSAVNPLSNIPDTNTRHMVMQVLAWMWCIIFSMWMGSIMVFGISALAHALSYNKYAAQAVTDGGHTEFRLGEFPTEEQAEMACEDYVLGVPYD
jgi:hypothetical protein